MSAEKNNDTNPIDFLQKFAEDYSLFSYIKDSKTEVEICIDSTDVFSILLSALSYSRGKKKNSTYLNYLNNKNIDEKLLTHAYLYNNYLGKCYLLTPHQQELLINIEKWSKQTPPLEPDFQNIQAQIVTSGLSFLNRKSPIQNYVNNVEKYKDEFESIVLDLYKISYLANGNNWNERLLHLMDNEILQLDVTDNILDLLQTNLFKSLKRGFRESQGRTDNMNTADALALCIIAEKLAKINRGESNATLPIFYDASGQFLEVIEQQKLTNHFLFSPKNSSNKKFLIIKSSNYFRLHVLLPHDILETNNGLENLIQIAKDYTKNAQISSKSTDKTYGLELNKKVQNINLTIERLLKSLLMKKFYNKNKINASLEDIIINKDKKPKLREKIALDIDDLIVELKQKLKSYIIESGTYNSIESSLLNIANQPDLFKNLRRYKLNSEEFQSLKTFSLVKFSINSDIKQDTEELLESIFLKTKIKPLQENTGYREIEIEDATIYTSIITSLTEGLDENQKKEKKYLANGISILWVLGKYKLIQQILNQLNGAYDYYGTAFLHAAAISKQIKSEEDFLGNKIKIENILNYVDGYGINGKYRFLDNYRTALSAAHIYFQLWDKTNMDEIKFPSLTEPNINKSVPESKHYADKALLLLETAIEWLLKNNYKKYNHRKECYFNILNNYIYYITIAYPNEVFLKINTEGGVVHKLGSASNDDSVWQPIFDDTLALVNYRKALNKKRHSEEYKNLISEANRRINLAINGVLRIDDYKKFMETRNNIREIDTNNV